MKARAKQQSGASWLTLLELATCAAGFASVVWLRSVLSGGQGSTLRTQEGLTSLAVSAATFWLAMPFWERGSSDALRVWIEQFFTALGFILIVQSALSYFFLISPIPWWLLLAATVLTIALMAALRNVLYPVLDRRSAGTLLIGFDPTAETLVETLRGELVGAVERDPSLVPAGVRYLGGAEQLPEVVAEQHPRRVIVSDAWRRTGIRAQALLALRYSGVALDHSMATYENRLGRVCWMRLQPAELLFSSPLNATRSVMALQAIYTNLIGLALLLLLAPVMFVSGLAILVFSGGPILEYVECAGFQRIPFLLRRFRTRRPNGEFTWIGQLLERWRIVHLPELINIVRGEMSLFGPTAPRRVFADRLCQIMPMYSQRFLIKPGILGWAQVNLRNTDKVMDEHLRLEYDLYYVKRGSPSLDLEIFVRTILQWPYSPQQAAPVGKPAGTI